MSAKTKIITLIAILIVCLGMIVYGTISEGNSIMDIMPRLILMGLTAVVVIIRIVSNSPKKQTFDKEALKKDIVTAKEWIKAALESSGYRADFSIESLKDIDRFFDEQNKDEGILSQNTGRILFALGVYVGETIIANYGGQWDLSNCNSETSIKVKLNEKTELFPVVRVMSRYDFGNVSSIYAYGCCVNKDENQKQSDVEIETSIVETKNIDDIWKIEEKENFIVALDQYIAEKCEYGDKMEVLNVDQRVLYITQALEMEVNNGGFAQFFFNSDGCFGNELVASFEKIGAKKTAEICKKAISIYGDKVPTDRDEREEILTPDDEKEEERIEEILDECDDAFFEYEDDLLELNYQFIINNKESFLK